MLVMKDWHEKRRLVPHNALMMVVVVVISSQS